MLEMGKRDLEDTMSSARQLGVGAKGGTETIAFIHAALDDLYRRNELINDVAIIQIDQKTDSAR